MKKDKTVSAAKGGKKIKNSTKLFFSGVFILTFTNIIVKAIGLLFKVPMNHIVGDEGMGYYSSAYTIYTLLYMVSTAGLPVAVSKMLSESRAAGKLKQSKLIFKTALTLFVIIGSVGTLIMLVGAKPMSALIKAEPTYACIIAIAPTLFFICITSALRGYFQGYQQMAPTAVSQFIEAVCKLLIGIVMAQYAISQDYPIHIVAAYAAIGLTIGAALGMIFLTVAKLTFNESRYNAEYIDVTGESYECASRSAILKRLVKIAIPITLSSSVMSLTNLIDTALVQRLLQSAGMTQEAATTVWGNYTSLATPMFNLPPVLVYPIGYSIIPLLSVAIEQKNTERAKLIMQSSLRVAVMIGAPCALGMSALAGPILHLFFSSASADMATPLLRLLAPSSFFVCLLAVTNAILQAHGYEKKPLISMLIGAIVKIATNLVLIRFIGMSATPISTFACYLTVTLCNFYFVAKYVKLIPSFKSVFLRPLISAVICALAALGSYALVSRVLPLSLSVIAAIAIAGVIYVLLIFATKAVTRDDILLLPKGEAIARLLEKFKLIRR